jgi:hypothetical protein
VYEVDLVDPEVDANMHRHGVLQELRWVMSPEGTVVRLAHQLAVADYPRAISG